MIIQYVGICGWCFRCGHVPEVIKKQLSFCTGGITQPWMFVTCLHRPLPTVHVPINMRILLRKWSDWKQHEKRITWHFLVRLKSYTVTVCQPLVCLHGRLGLHVLEKNDLHLKILLNFIFLKCAYIYFLTPGWTALFLILPDNFLEMELFLSSYSFVNFAPRYCLSVFHTTWFCTDTVPVFKQEIGMLHKYLL